MNSTQNMVEYLNRERGKSREELMRTMTAEMFVFLSFTKSGIWFSNDPTKSTLDPKTSRRIFELARDQQQELDISGHDGQDDEDAEAPFAGHRTNHSDDEDDSNSDVYGGDSVQDADETFVSVGSRCRSLMSEIEYRNLTQEI